MACPNTTRSGRCTRLAADQGCRYVRTWSWTARTGHCRRTSCASAASRSLSATLEALTKRGTWHGISSVVLGGDPKPRGGVVMAKPLVSDELWEILQPLLPPPKPRRFRYPGRKPVEDRKALTGILFV